MSIGWSSSIEKEEVRKSFSIWIWTMCTRPREYIVLYPPCVLDLENIVYCIHHVYSTQRIQCTVSTMCTLPREYIVLYPPCVLYLENIVYCIHHVYSTQKIYCTVSTMCTRPIQCTYVVYLSFPTPLVFSCRFWCALC